MSKEYEITYCTTECLEQTINILKEISKDYKWENEQEYIRTIYMLSTKFKQCNVMFLLSVTKSPLLDLGIICEKLRGTALPCLPHPEQVLRSNNIS